MTVSLDDEFWKTVVKRMNVRCVICLFKDSDWTNRRWTHVDSWTVTIGLCDVTYCNTAADDSINRTSNR